MSIEPTISTTDLIACPICDMLHTAAELPSGARMRCRRCNGVIITNRRGAIDRVLAASLASAVLMLAAIFFPFLDLSIAGLHQNASVLDAALAYSEGLMAPLALAVALLIVVLPLVRASALTYTLLPLRLGRPAAPGARQMLRLASELKPWSMAEVFLIGVVVALVKMGGMATIGLGPGFWAMAGLVLVVVIEAANLCEWSIWQQLDTTPKA